MATRYIVIYDIYSTYSYLTPNAVKASKALVVLDTAMTSITLGWRIALHPYMLHSLQRGKRECYKLFTNIKYNQTKTKSNKIQFPFN